MEENIEANRQMSLKLAQASKLASIGTLASGVAHELNNPLAGIRGYAEALQLDENLRPEDKSTLNRILHLSDRMAKTIQQLLRISRQQNESENEFCNLKTCIDETLELMQKQLDCNFIKLNIKFNTSKIDVRGSSHRITSVLQNLLANSRDAFMTQKHSESPLIEISIYDSVSLPGGICIEFKDNAGGIDEKIINYVFDPFFTTKDVGMGTGLGLAIVRNSIDEVGGKITLEVKAPHTTFKIDLEGASQNNIDSYSQGTKPKMLSPQQSLPVSRPSILVVDDEVDICELFEIIYSKYYKITAVTDPVTAIQLIHSDKFELVLTDLKMPSLSGQEIAQEVFKAQPECKVAIMSGHELQIEKDQFKGSDEVLFINKPLPSRDEMIFLINQHLAKVKSAA